MLAGCRRRRFGRAPRRAPVAPRSGRSSGQRPNRQLVATRRHGSATVNSTHRLSLTLRSPPLFMKCAAATSGHQFPLVRFPASCPTLYSEYVRDQITAVTNLPLEYDSQASEAMNIAEGGSRGMVAQHDERRRKAMRATRFRRAALFAERLGGTGKKVKGREIDVAPWL